MDVLTQDILNESAFEISDSIISSDMGLLSSHTNLVSIDDDSQMLRTNCFNFNETNRIIGPIDPEDDLSLNINNPNGNPAHSTRLRRRKASQPQRLVYCNLDFNGILQETQITLENKETSNLIDNLLDSNIIITNLNEEQKAEEPVKPKSKKNNNFECEICGVTLTSQTRLKSHNQSHELPENLKCNICSKSFAWEYAWKAYLPSHSEKSQSKCPQCGLKLFNKTALSNHIKRKHGQPNRSYACSECGKGFISKSELKQHSFIHLKEKQWQCGECGKSFRCKSYMERHHKTHSGIKPYKCAHCGKLLSDKTGFTAHVRAHLGEKPYACSICGKKYTIKRHLTSHMIIHSDARPFKCEQCDKTFRSRTNLRMHKDNHLGVKRWSCKFCGRNFLSQGNMAKHVRRHIGERKHKCEVCSKAFIEKQELKSHLKMHEKEKVLPQKSSESEVCPNLVEAEKHQENDSNLAVISILDSDSVAPIFNCNSLQSATSSNSFLPPMTNNVAQSVLFSESNFINIHSNGASSNLEVMNAKSTNSLASNKSNVVSLFSFSPNGQAVTLHTNSIMDTNSPIKCTLCNNTFLSSCLLKNHLIDFHRVESEKIISIFNNGN